MCPNLKNRFLYEKIAITFNNREEHDFILRYFDKPVGYSSFNAGICSFYTHCEINKGLPKVVHTYSCTTTNNRQYPYGYAGYTILTFAEFEWLIDDTWCYKF